MQKIKGGITTPKGFLANSLNCGIKKKKHDLALLFSRVPAKALAVFTQNKVKAAPIIVSQKHVKNSTCMAIFVNSGNANCCNGKKGLKDAEKMAGSAAKTLKIPNGEVLIASTGVIGKALPIKLIERATPSLVKGLHRRNARSFAKAIMTTDKFMKQVACKIKVGGSTVTIGGVAKGAGMINPNMATMLSFLTTDAAITKDALKASFKRAVDKSFNSISVDGATSTNDCVFILANGCAKNKTITKNSASFDKFSKALHCVTLDLAEKIVLDGEGATKLVYIIVKNAKNYEDAKKIAKSVANDPLFKTSVYGEDPNWGRIAAAVGASSVNTISDNFDIYLGSKRVFKGGAGVNTDIKALKNIYKKKSIKVVIDLKSGNKESKVVTCDLTKKYIEINSSYTT